MKNKGKNLVWILSLNATILDSPFAKTPAHGGKAV